MKVINTAGLGKKLSSSLLFTTYPLLFFIFRLDLFLFLLLLCTIISQTTLAIAEIFYYVKWTILIIFIISEFLLIGYANLKTDKYQIILSRCIVLLFIFLAYILITSLYSIDIPISLFKSGTFFLLIFSTIILIPFLADYFGNKYDIINAIYIFSAIVIVLNILAFQIYPIKPIAPHLQIRFRGFLENPNTLGMICFTSLPVFLFKYKSTDSKKIKIITIVLILAAILLPIISLSRASVLGIIILLVVYYYYFNRKIFYLAVLIIIIVAFIVLSSPVLMELLRLADDPLSQRDKVWELGLNAWKEHVIFGAGYGTTHIVTSNKYIFMNKGISDFLLGKHFNNIYLEVLYETGIIGIILFLVTLFYLNIESIKTIKKISDKDKILAICYFSLLIAVMFQSIFESFILSAGNASSLIFWTLTGLALCSGKGIDRKIH